MIALWLSVPASRADETNAAASLIPFGSLTAANQVLVRSVTDHYTLRREYDARQFKAQKKYLDYFLDHLDACSVLAQSMGLIQYRAARGVDGRLFADNHRSE